MLISDYRMINGTTDWFKRCLKRPLSPSELNNEGSGQALVLRYAGCNFGHRQCPLCYAWRYAWSITKGGQYTITQTLNALNNLSTQASRKIVWIRIQGGEPCLTYGRIVTTIEFAYQALKKVDQLGLNYYSISRSVIQTNALTFGALDRRQMSKVINQLQIVSQKITDCGRIIFEVSFKSSNNLAYLKHQYTGYSVLLKNIMIPLWNNGVKNIAVYPLAGLGPSIDSHNVWLIPIESGRLGNEIPLFHNSCWDALFKNLVSDFINNIVPQYPTYKDFRKNPKTNKGRKLAIEELEATRFQKAWISRYATPNTQPPITAILRKTDNNVNPQWHALFKGCINGLAVMNSIPMSSNSSQLLQDVRSMNEYFYPSHPRGHYPYL